MAKVRIKKVPSKKKVVITGLPNMNYGGRVPLPKATAGYVNSLIPPPSDQLMQQLAPNPQIGDPSMDDQNLPGYTPPPTLNNNQMVQAIGDDPANQVPESFAAYSDSKGKKAGVGDFWKRIGKWGALENIAGQGHQNRLDEFNEGKQDIHSWASTNERENVGDYDQFGRFRLNQQDVGNSITGKFGGNFAYGGANASIYGNQMAPFYNSEQRAMSTPETEVRSTMTAVPRDEANIEAEGGETAYLPDKGGLPTTYKISGNRHHGGGVPLNVPKDTFIYSDTKKMKIKNPEYLEYFGYPKDKKGITPAEISKKYDISKYRKTLDDPESDYRDIETAEKMIANYNLKLGRLALIQESMKGFPQGIPAAAMPYMATYNIKPEDILPLKPGEEQAPQMEEQMGDQMAISRFGGARGPGGFREMEAFPTQPTMRQFFDKYSSIPMAALGANVTFADNEDSGKSIPGFEDPNDFREFTRNYPAIAGIYKNALSSGDPNKMRQASKLILDHQQEQTPWYSLDVNPWSDADKFSDIASILNEQANAIRARVEKSAFEQQQVQGAQLETDALAKLSAQYDATPETDYMTRLNLDSQMRKIAEKDKYKAPIAGLVKQVGQIAAKPFTAGFQKLFPETYVGPDLGYNKYDPEYVAKLQAAAGPRPAAAPVQEAVIPAPTSADAKPATPVAPRMSRARVISLLQQKDPDITAEAVADISTEKLKAYLK